MNYLKNILIILVAALLPSLTVYAANSVVLLVEKPAAEQSGVTIATAQAALDKFTAGDSGSQANIAVISYAMTADVLQPLSSISTGSAGDISQLLKQAGNRTGSINTAAGLERAVSLLTDNTNPEDSRHLLVVSDALIDTGDAEMDSQFEEWMTQIIAEDAQREGISVQWFPVTKNANHTNIDAFLANLEGNRVVVTPDEKQVTEADKPLPVSEAEQKLAEIREQREKTLALQQPATEPKSVIENQPSQVRPATQSEPETPQVLVQAPVVAPQPEVAAPTPIPEPAPAPEPEPEPALEPEPKPESVQTASPEPENLNQAEPVTLQSQPQAEPVPPVALNNNQPSLADTASDRPTTSITTSPKPGQPAENLMGGLTEFIQSGDNLRYAALGLAVLAGGGLLLMMITRKNKTPGTGATLSDREYTTETPTPAPPPAVGPVTLSTLANAPVIPERKTVSSSAADPAPSVSEPEPADKDEPVAETESDVEKDLADDLDGTQEVFGDFSSASLSAAPAVKPEPLPEPEPIIVPDSEPDLPEVAPEQKTEANTPDAAEETPETNTPESSDKNGDPYATVIASLDPRLREDLSSPEVPIETSEDNKRASVKPADPYASALASQPQAETPAAKPVTADDDRTVLAADPDIEDFADDFDDIADDDRTVLASPDDMKFSEDFDDDRTVLAPGIGDAIRFSQDSTEDKDQSSKKDDDDDKTMLERPGE